MDRQAQRDIRRKLNCLQFAQECGSNVLACRFSTSCPRGAGKTVLHVHDELAFGPAHTDEDTPWIRCVEGFLEVFHLTLDQLTHAGPTDSRTAAVVGAKPVVFCEIQNALAVRVPRGGDAGTREGNFTLTTELFPCGPHRCLAAKLGLVRQR